MRLAVETGRPKATKKLKKRATSPPAVRWSDKEVALLPLPLLRTVRATFTAHRYENIILRASRDGSAIVRLKDVARAEVGRRAYIDNNRLNGAPSALVAVYQQPGANGLEVSKAVRQTLERLKRTMPDGIEYQIVLDTTEFVRLSIEEIIYTLMEAVALVVLIVYVFLQSFRATIICTVAIFVALIGTFPGMLAMGFSINLLTLFGIVLAIGMVVDDSHCRGGVDIVKRRVHEQPSVAQMRSGEIGGTVGRRPHAFIESGAAFEQPAGGVEFGRRKSFELRDAGQIGHLVEHEAHVVQLGAT